ncbi:MAG: lipopolysaccharide biosynthesis protein [Hyphomicrobiales bacterium]
MNPLKKLAGQTLIYGMGTIIPRIMNYAVLTPLYTQTLQDGAYGTYTIIYIYVAFLMMCLTFGMETAFFRFTQSDNPKRVFSTAFLSVSFISIAFLIIAYFLSNDLTFVLKLNGHAEYIKLFTAFVVMDALCAIPFAKLRQENRPKFFASLKIVNVILLLALNTIMLLWLPKFAESNPNSFLGEFYFDNTKVTFILIANLIASSLIFIILIPEFFKVQLRMDYKLLRRMLIYSLPILVVSLAGWANEQGGKIILDRFLDSDISRAEVGLYSANTKIAVMMILFVQMFRYAAEPFFFNESNKDDAKQTYANVMKYFVLASWLIFLGITLYIDIVKYFIGSLYWKGLHVVPIILIGYIFYGIYFNLSIWYKLNNKTIYGAIMAIIGVVVTLGLNFLLIPKIGYLGSAWASLFCYLIMMLISYFLGKKHFPVPYPKKRILIYSVSALAVFFISFFVQPLNLYVRLSWNTFLLLIFLGINMRKEINMVYNKILKK